MSAYEYTLVYEEVNRNYVDRVGKLSNSEISYTEPPIHGQNVVFVEH